MKNERYEQWESVCMRKNRKKNLRLADEFTVERREREYDRKNLIALCLLH